MLLYQNVLYENILYENVLYETLLYENVLLQNVTVRKCIYIYLPQRFPGFKIHLLSLKGEKRNKLHYSYIFSY